MDTFVRTLSISNSQHVKDVTNDCAKLIIWLQCDDGDVDYDVGSQQHAAVAPSLYRYSNLTYKAIETMFKATIYLHYCFHIHGGEILLQSMLAEHAWARSLLESYHDQYTKDSCVPQLCRRIINNGPSDQLGSRYCMVMQLLKIISDIEPSWRKHLNEDFIKVTKNTNTSIVYENDSDEDLLRMLSIVRCIFELPTKAGIEKAVQRLVEYLPFNILGLLFKMTPKSSRTLYNKCEVLAEKVCQELTTAAENVLHTSSSSSSSTAGHFIKGIYLYSASSRHGLQFLWQCLAHHTFADSLIHYLLKFYDHQLQHINMDTLELDSLMAVTVPLASILYLSHVLLARMSPCRMNFYALIKETDYSETLLTLINKVAYVYS